MDATMDPIHVDEVDEVDDIKVNKKINIANDITTNTATNTITNTITNTTTNTPDGDATDGDATDGYPTDGDATTTGNKSTTEQEYEVDFAKPLLWQVGHLGKHYNSWLRRIKLGSFTMFQNPYVEYGLTQFQFLPFWVIWAWYISSSCCLGWVFTGIMAWTLLEYSMHRFIYHFNPKDNYWLITFHFIIHGCHHKFPKDIKHTITPFSITMVIYLALNAISFLHCNFIAGILLGSVWYEISHYLLHKNVFNQAHTRHHYKDDTKNFGVTSLFWDHVFGTLA
jgi:dihydroceramide fatty acyl 2-hydroxylase